MAEPALVCRGLDAGWGDTQVLSGVSFALPKGEVLAVLGRNGVGKSTLLSMIIESLVDAIGRLRRDGDIAILLVEQHVALALEFTDRVLVLDRGLIVYDNADGSKPVDPARIRTLTGL